MIKSIKVVAFKYIRKAITVKDTDTFVIISGRNRQGKTCLIDSIRWAIVGGNNSKVINHNEDEARVVLSMDKGTTIERSLLRDAKKGRVSVTKGDGSTAENPEGMIASFFSIHCFDPIKFCTLTGKEQAEIVRTALASRLTITPEEAKLMGFTLDPVLRIDEQLDTWYDKFYKERTGLKRQIDIFEKTQANTKVTSVPTEEEIADLEEEVKSLSEEYDAAVENNAKASVAAGNKTTAEKLRTQLATLNEALEALGDSDPVSDKDIKELEDKYNESTREEGELRGMAKQLEKTLTELGDNEFPVCPISKRVSCSTDMSSVKAGIARDLKEATAKLKKLNTANATMKESLNEMRETFDNQKDKKTKTTERDRVKATLETIEVSDCEPIETTPIQDELNEKRNLLASMKAAKEFAGASDIEAVRKKWTDCDNFVDEIRNFKEKVLPQRIKLDIPDIKLKADGIYFRDTILSEECTSVQLRIAVAIMKTLFPKNNLMTIDRLESLDTETLKKFIKNFTESGKIQVFATFVGEIPKAIAQMEGVTVIEMEDGDIV